MNMLHKGKKNKSCIEFSEEQPKPLCSNEGVHGCSSLDFDTITEDVALDKLARILTDIFFRQLQREKFEQKQKNNN